MESDNKHPAEIAPKSFEPIAFFDKDGDFVLAYKKTEKLASAIYMVTNLFSDNEPMKWILRRKSSDLVSFSLTYKDVSELVRADFLYEIRTRVLEFVSFLEIAFRAGLVSQMNFSILKQEFQNLIAIFSNTESPVKSPLNKDISRIFYGDLSNIQTQKYDYNKSVSIGDPGAGSRLSFMDLKDKSQLIINKDDLKRSNRQNIILSLLKRKKELNIKDITLVIKDCSEKTVQRELNAFIVSGVVKRVGVRRWSKYSLV